ncbi:MULTISPECIES: hypothetical protein [unclassified Bradyrhizobium]|nr:MULTISPECIES: hypothetical protein [unclassified Bradyrhizobium]
MVLLDAQVVARSFRAAARLADGQLRIVLFAIARDIEELIAKETAAD